MEQLTDFFLKLFDSSDWAPRWQVGKWDAFHGWLFVISDLLIFFAYFTIPVVIIRFITRRNDASFGKLYFLFAAFILACGATHLLDAVAFWVPMYRLNSLVAFITAILSWVTVFYIIRYLPVAFSLKSAKALENEIEQRKIAEAELRFSEEQVQAIYKHAPDAVIVITSKGIIVKWNPAAEKLLGWKEEEVLGKVLNDLIIPEHNRQGHIDSMKYFLKTGTSPLFHKTMLQQVYDKAGEPRLVEFTVSPVASKDDFLFIGFVRDVTQKRKDELALKESEERYRLLTSEVYDYAIIMLTIEGKVSSWNEGAYSITGYTEAEMIDHNFSLFYTEADKEKGLPQHDLAVANEAGRYEYERSRVRKNGETYWANVVITALKRDGSIIGYSEISKDVTERKKMELQISKVNELLEEKVKQRTEALQESEKKYKKLFENSPLPMWVLALPSHRFLDVNKAAILHYGYSREEFLNMTALDIRPEEERPRFLTHDQNASQGIKNYGTWKHLKKDGSLMYVDVNSHRMTIGDQPARLVLSVDITDRKLAEDRLEFTLKAGQIGIWELDILNDNSARNLQHDQLFGYEQPLDHWGIDDFMNHLHPDDKDQVEISFKEAMLTGNWMVETRVVWPDQSVHWLLITGKFISDHRQEINSLFGTVVDITRVKQAEEEIRELNNQLEQRVASRTRELYLANKELESFSYSVSHDLRAPLRAIHGYSQILLEDYNAALDQEGNRILERVMFNAKKMGRLIDDLLEFSRLGKKTMHKTTINLNKMVAEVINEMSQSSKYHLNITVGELGTAFADQATLHLVFQNLLLNATKYSSKKEAPLVEVGITETANGTSYYVKDNGAGFDMTYYEKLFGVFQRFHRQEEFEGTGVGLAIVQRIILKHGGQIWAESAVNEGATFYFTLQ